jgi:peptidoglycan/LPS O-acetylase OafA/YrhL
MAVTYSPATPSHAYYGTQGRLQELFIGCALAVLVPQFKGLAGQWIGGSTAIGGSAGLAALALLIAFCRLRDDSAGYYRGGALGACLVVAVLIAGVELQPTGRLARIFSWPPAVGLGRISYGVYLWHWPLVVAIEINDGMTSHQHLVRQSLRVGITLAAAIASYFLVEKPILGSRRLLRRPKEVIIAAVAGSARHRAQDPYRSLLDPGAPAAARGDPGAVPHQRRDRQAGHRLHHGRPTAGASAGLAQGHLVPVLLRLT